MQQGNHDSRYMKSNLGRRAFMVEDKENTALLAIGKAVVRLSVSECEREIECCLVYIIKMNTMVSFIGSFWEFLEHRNVASLNYEMDFVAHKAEGVLRGYFPVLWALERFTLISRRMGTTKRRTEIFQCGEAWGCKDLKKGSFLNTESTREKRVCQMQGFNFLCFWANRAGLQNNWHSLRASKKQKQK